ncbi:hypothetical protein ABIF50_001791 [Bradyrhizobium diazoefficiens]
MTRILPGIFAAALALSASAVQAEDKPPLKIGGILDMSSLYADITGPGSETAAKMAAEDFGGEVLGRKIQVLAADHLNKADLSANIARDMLDNQGVEMIYDVAASATALAAGEIAKARNKIIMFNGPGSIRLTNEACGPYTVHYVFDTYGQANVTGLAAVKSGLDTWFFLTADYAFGQDLEKDTSAVVTKTGGKVLGGVRHPLNTSDFSSFLLQAQASKAKVIGLANAGGDTVNAIKQAAEFGITKGGQKVSPLIGLRDRYRFDRTGDRARPAAGGSLLLGPQRRHACILQALHRAHEAAADLGAGRRLLLRDALPESCEGGGHDGCGCGHQGDEGDADQRFLRQGWQDPRGRPHDPRHVLVRGEEAVGIQGPLGRLQAARHRARQRSVPVAGAVALPAGEEVTA